MQQSPRQKQAPETLNNDVTDCDIRAQLPAISFLLHGLKSITSSFGSAVMFLSAGAANFAFSQIFGLYATSNSLV